MTRLGPLTVEIEPIRVGLVFVTGSLRERMARKLIELQDRDCGDASMGDAEWADFWPKHEHLWGPQADELIAVALS